MITPKKCKALHPSALNGRNHTPFPSSVLHLCIALFKARSVSSDQQAQRRNEIAEFMRDNDLDIMLMTEKGFRDRGDESVCVDTI